MENIYYDGTKLLSLQDINGQQPELFLCVGNRTAGKTVFFKRMCTNAFLNKGEQFLIEFRFNYELKGCGDMFFSDIGPLFFQGYEVSEESVAQGLFYKINLNGKTAGFAVSLSNADSLKKYSSYFVNVKNIFLDEFQSETDHYASNEIKKFQSVHYTVARGQGKQYRYTRTILCGNAVSLLNPYFIELGIHKKLKQDTKFLKGEGWVLEQTFNKNAAKAISESGFSKAFSGQYTEYATQNIYLNDNSVFVEKLSGNSRYMYTIKFDNMYYGVRMYSQDGIIFVNDKPDLSHPYVMTFKASDHQQNALMVERNDMIVKQLKKYFNLGLLRFGDLRAKNMILDILSI